MKIAGKQDIAAPTAEVYAAVTDFEFFERSAIRRGARICRVEGDGHVARGTCWDTAFDLRGRTREMRLSVTDVVPAEKLAMLGESDGLKGHVLIDVVPLSPRRTRLRVELDLKPQTLSTRLLVQSLKLARGNIETRLSNRLAEFGAMIENRSGRA
ncbi:SRPBCC family protein [Pseudooceanicola aestuarii]|uniref:SRPBCC family protein n=1 Tax=Pseudooceanicola aestuarii TaxID=2697319 RepID=UPI0013D458F8|nr:SRPBCC family protein [Pseudooceanicola aestuarii]